MIRVRRFGGQEELTTFLQGGVIGGEDLANKVVYGLHGLTLKFDSPASETVTFDFTGAEYSPATVQQVKTQIEAQTTGVLVRFYQGRLVLIENTPSSGVALHHDGTANAKLGFGQSATVSTVGQVYHSDGVTSPYLIDVVQCPFAGGGLLVLTEE
jgi:hypothetical protein